MAFGTANVPHTAPRRTCAPRGWGTAVADLVALALLLQYFPSAQSVVVTAVCGSFGV